MPKICRFLFLLVLSATLLACTQNPQRATQKAALRAVAKTDTSRITNPALKALATKLDGLLTRYYALSPFNNVEIDSIRLPKAVIDTLLKENTSEEYGKIGGLTLIGYYQGEISNVVDSILKHPAVGRYPLQALLPGAIASDDGRLITFSIDQQTGGTYHSMFTWTQYRAPDGKIFNYYADDGLEDKTDGILMVTVTIRSSP